MIGCWPLRIRNRAATATERDVRVDRDTKAALTSVLSAVTAGAASESARATEKQVLQISLLCVSQHAAVSVLTSHAGVIKANLHHVHHIMYSTRCTKNIKVQTHNSIVRILKTCRPNIVLVNL